MFSEPICRDVHDKNKMLNYMYGCLKKYIPDMHVMNLMATRKYMANEAHVWGGCSDALWGQLLYWSNKIFKQFTLISSNELKADQDSFCACKAYEMNNHVDYFYYFISSSNKVDNFLLNVKKYLDLYFAERNTMLIIILTSNMMRWFQK